MEEFEASHQRNNPTLKQRPWKRVSDWGMRENPGLFTTPPPRSDFTDKPMYHRDSSEGSERKSSVLELTEKGRKMARTVKEPTYVSSLHDPRG